MTKTMPGASLLCILALALGGCRHKAQLAPLPPVLSPVDLVEVPPMANPPVVETPQVKLPPVPTAAAALKPGRERRRSSKTAAGQTPPPASVSTPPVTPAPTQAATTETPADVAAIGSLTAGGEENPQMKQEASSLIATIEKRLNGLPAKMADDQKTQVSKVKNFLRDAQEALKTGDSEGAVTLATKAKLLLDDFEK